MSSAFIAIAIIALLIVITVVPVMLAARWLGAERTGFFAALIGIVMHWILMVGTAIIVVKVAPPLTQQWMIIAVSVAIWLVNWVGGGIVYSSVLGTTLWRGIGIGIISWITSEVLDKVSSMPFYVALVAKANAEP